MPIPAQQSEIFVEFGGINTDVPAHLIGNKGAAYHYGTTVVNGTRNFFSSGRVGYSYDPGDASAMTLTNPYGWALAGTLAGTGTDAIRQAFHVAMFGVSGDTVQKIATIANGEVLIESTLFPGIPGAACRDFTTAGTVTVATGSPSVTGVGTAFTTATINQTNPTQRALNLIRPGDVLGVDTGGNRRWYRIVRVNAASGAAALTIFPPSVQNGNFAYVIYRTGYGSYSRVIGIPSAVSESNSVFPYLYWAGSFGNTSLAPGTIYGIGYNSLNTLETCYQTVNSAGTHTGASPQAADIALYKSFLFYGWGTGVSWSRTPFPGAFPFASNDFPAANIAVLDPTDKFVSFEYLGDQLLAIFRRGIWQVQPTGSIPEFAFYKLAEPIGALHEATGDPCGVGFGSAFDDFWSFSRPTCSGRGAVYYVSPEGVQEFTGTTSRLISEPVNEISNVLYPPIPGTFSFSELFWEPVMDAVTWRRAASGSDQDRTLVLNVKKGEWHSIQVPIQASHDAITGLSAGNGYRPSINPGFRVPNFAAIHRDTGVFTWDPFVMNGAPEERAESAYTVPWLWTTPLIDLGKDYPGFKFGGFLPDAESTGIVSPNSQLTWTLYGGTNPYDMVVRGTGVFNYEDYLNSRERLGKQLDDTYVGITLTGQNWIAIPGIRIFDARTTAVR